MISFELILLLLVVLIIAIFIAIYLVIKKELLIVFSGKKKEIIKEEIINLLREQGYRARGKGERIRVEKGFITSANLHLEQDGNDVNVFGECSLGFWGWMLLFVLFFWWSFGIATIILAAIFDYNSKNFATKTILPLLKESKLSK